jgi:hypothetical protein
MKNYEIIKNQHNNDKIIFNEFILNKEDRKDRVTAW